MKPLIIAACVLFWAGAASAGAWEAGSFDNDDALDWVWELAESDDLSIVEDALQAAVDTTGYLEAPTASVAIAAAEVVAVLRGYPKPGLPAEVTNWALANPHPVSDELAATAQAVVKRVQDVETSELAELWSESDEMMEEWHLDLANLLTRLQQ